jgi:hypothetical protein
MDASMNEGGTSTDETGKGVAFFDWIVSAPYVGGMVPSQGKSTSSPWATSLLVSTMESEKLPKIIKLDSKAINKPHTICR